MFFNYVSHLLFGFFTVHFTSLTFIANVQSANAPLTLTDIVFVNHKKKQTFKIEIPRRNILPGAKFQTLDLATQIFFALQPHKKDLCSNPDRSRVF